MAYSGGKVAGLVFLIAVTQFVLGLTGFSKSKNIDKKKE
jgi:hypothetical protein